MKRSINFDKISNSGRHCPECGCTDFKNDLNRAEVYCKNCGVIVSCPEHYVAGRKVKAEYSYDYSEDDADQFDDLVNNMRLY